MVKNLPAMQETRAGSLGGEESLEKGIVTHSSVLAWRIPWTESLEGDSPYSREESDTTEHICTRIFYVGVDSNFFLVVTFILE